MRIQKFLSLLVLIVLSACSSSEKANEEIALQNKVYSDETNRAFEMIELGYGNGAIKKIRAPVVPPQVRYESKPKVIILEKDSAAAIPIEAIDETIAYQPAKPKAEPKTAPRAKAAPAKSSEKLSEKESEKMVELNQNLAFYCMKHRKENRFKNNEKKCMDYVAGILNQCQNNNSAHAKLLTCVKKRLTLK